jgi:hypothetical protein
VPSEVPLLSVSLGALATLAFLVVFNALINDFFWMDIRGSFNFFQSLYFSSARRHTLMQMACQTTVAPRPVPELFKVNDLAPSGGGTAVKKDPAVKF